MSALQEEAVKRRNNIGKGAEWVGAILSNTKIRKRMKLTERATAEDEKGDAVVNGGPCGNWSTWNSDS